VTIYSPHQLTLLLVLVVAMGTGLAIGEWRRANPELAAALERVDRVSEDDRPEPPPRPAAVARVAPSPPIVRPVTPPAPARPLDINRASVDDLTRLPGIGPVLAARIVAARDANGAFRSVDDLRRVSGVGPAKLSALRDRIVFAP
jgi:competence protein ComEA